MGEGAHQHVIEATDQNFASAVLDESHTRPVVVDFWAGWCQPCRVIGPVLERLADQSGGDFLLAKLDVDANRQMAAAFRIQGIPAVMAFRDGRVVDQFVGAIPEQSIRQFIQGVLPSDADRLAAEGEEAERAGRPDEATRLYREALARQPGHPQSSLGLGRLAVQDGRLEEARTLLRPLVPDPEAERLLAAIEVAEWGTGAVDGDGPLAEAERAAAEGRFADALKAFLREVESGQERDQAREGMLKIFSILGDEDPLTVEYRRRLATALF